MRRSFGGRLPQANNKVVTVALDMNAGGLYFIGDDGEADPCDLDVKEINTKRMTANEEKTFYLQLGDQVACIRCEDRGTGRLLRQLHPPNNLDPASKVVAAYLIPPAENERLRLLCQDQVLYDGSSLFNLVQYLMHDLATTLITRCRQHLVFHAAGLACDQAGLLLCGQSGQGKSTLAAWLTHFGFDYLSDELVTISLGQGEMRGLLRPLIVKKGSAPILQRWFAKRLGRLEARFPNGTLWLNPHRLRSKATRTSAWPELILFPRYAADTPFSAQQLSLAGTTFQLMQHLVNAANLPDYGLSAVTKLARQTTAYLLTYDDVNPVTQWLAKTGWGSGQ